MATPGNSDPLWHPELSKEENDARREAYEKSFAAHRLSEPKKPGNEKSKQLES